MFKNFEMNSEEMENIRFFITAMQVKRNKRKKSIFMSRSTKCFLNNVADYDKRNAYYRSLHDQAKIAPIMKKIITCDERSESFQKILHDFRNRIIKAYNLEELLTIFNVEKEDIYHPRNKLLGGKYYEEALFSLGYHFYDFCCGCISNKISITRDDLVGIYKELFPNCFFSKKYTNKKPNEYQAKLLNKIYSERHDAANLCVRIVRIKRFYAVNPS